jgi:sulfur relay protein TusB/DsrH
MKTLHILRKTNDPIAFEAIRSDPQAAVLLIQDGVLAKGSFPVETYACREDLVARGLRERHRIVDYNEIARLIVEHDRVITW